MSAIWGCIDFSGNKIMENTSENMEKMFHSFKIDHFSNIVQNNAMMGCGLQHIKIWSKNEVLPKYDEAKGLLFTVDGVVDNRDEMIVALDIDNPHCPDGNIIFAAFEKWGAMMTKHLYGSYSYAAYNIKENELFLGGDHVATRALYYQIVGSKVYFSTRIDAILNASDEKEINEEWIALFMGVQSLNILTNPVDTPFKGVKRVEAFHYNHFTKDGMEKIKYWEYDDIKQLKLNSDEEYKQHFLSLFEKCVNETLAGIEGEPAIMLSGGFDSTVIGALAAKTMEKEGKNLYGYTHVPISKAAAKVPIMYRTGDESDIILHYCKMYPNIKPNFMSTPECDGFTDMKEIIKLYESPYKSHSNIAWVNAIYNKAGMNGHKILLNGQTGNATLSWGTMSEYLKDCIARKRFIKLITVANKYCKKMNYSRKLYFVYLMNMLKDNRKIDGKNYLEQSVLDKDMAKNVGIQNKDKRLSPKSGLMSIKHSMKFEAQRKEAINPIAFAHIADAETAFSLKNGIIVRDPTRDIRIFEFCSAIPMGCFVNDQCQTRRMARYYCKNLLPDLFFKETALIGVQSADWFERLEPKWPEIYADIKRVLDLPQVSKYVKKEYKEHQVAKLKTLEKSAQFNADLLTLGSIYLVGLFIEQHELY